MRALLFNGTLSLADLPKPVCRAGEVLIRVTTAGICNTDHEITRGYVPGFRGVPGHEFLGIVDEAEDTALVGTRVSAEINCACGACEWCARGLGRHCPDRTVLGIINRDGAFAEYLTVPRENVVPIPEEIPDNRAIFIEPLAAALEILDQVSITNQSGVLLLGDGKLALLIARVLASTGCCLTVVGKHPDKLALLSDIEANPLLLDTFTDGQYDFVVEATGNTAVFDRALRNAKPRGTVILKSTYAGTVSFNPWPVVVNEITILGSRCGRFEAAIDFLQKIQPPVERMISGEFRVEEGLKAFDYSERPETLKVVLKISG